MFGTIYRPFFARADFIDVFYNGTL
ncbi:unnamed protein product, partial [Allacma fusca]